MILSNIFMPYSKNRADIDQSTRRIMLILLREIINNRIEIEAMKKAIITKTEDSAGDTHDHREEYEKELGVSKAKWASDLADINKKLNTEEVYNEKWTGEYKKLLEGAPHYCTNNIEQMKTDANKIKQYDYVDKQPYNPAAPTPKAPTTSPNSNIRKGATTTQKTSTKTVKGATSR
jgi:hypothetical protein